MEDEIVGLVETELVVHCKHYQDGYPLCWPMDKMGLFEGSFDDGEVTCPDCLVFMMEE